MKRIALVLVLGSLAGLATAQMTPIGATGYNFDGIANGADDSAFGVETSTSGTLDSIYDYFTMGFDQAASGVGLPSGDFVSAANSNTTFALQAPDANNVLLLRQANSGQSMGTLTLNSPTAFTSLAFLVTGFNGSQPGSYTLHFADGSTSGGSFTASDNFGNSGYAIQGFGRVSWSDGSFDAINSSNPRLYEVDVNLSPTDQMKALSSIDFSNDETTGTTYHNIGVFGVSGEPVPEPASMAALGLGIAALIRKRRRS